MGRLNGEARRHTHAAVVERSAIPHAPAREIAQSHDWVVRGHRRIVTITDRLRKPVQQPTTKHVRLLQAQVNRTFRDLRSPVLIRATIRCVYFDVPRTVGEKYLSSWYEQHAPYKRWSAIVRRIRNREQPCAV